MGEEDLPDAEQFRLEQGVRPASGPSGRVGWRNSVGKRKLTGEPLTPGWPTETCASPCQFLGWICRTPKVRGDERRRDNRPPPAE
jgi:hypothetical protein